MTLMTDRYAPLAPNASPPQPAEASLVVMPWLVRLRWASIVALAAAAWAAQTFWQVRLPVVPLAGLLAALAATNAALALQLRSPVPRRAVVGAVLLVDVGLLTGILYLVGGPMNPFSIVYLVGVTVAATSLGHRWAIALGFVSSAAYAVTFFYNRPLEFHHPALGSGALTLHLSGMWVALTAAAGLIAYFVGRLSEALADREHELAEARAAAARSERLAALFALGAGAAHELATPLSTIQTAAGELARARHRSADDDAGAGPDYIAIIRREVNRCTRVLDQLSGRAAAASAAETHVSLTQLVEDLRRRLGDAQAQRLDVTIPPVDSKVALPAEPLRQALVAVLQNAFDASSPDQHVAIRMEHGPGLRVEVVDHGRGMDAAELACATDPFFTTKPPGAGLGLGLFLVRAFVDQMGGSLRVDSTPGAGTTVELTLPATT